MRPLSLWNDYTREEVHSIFSPGTRFTPQSGTWGLQGIVRVPSRQGDWVFFVTFGKEQGDHVFDESITGEGVLSWQSQPAQCLSDAVIKELIEHDDRVNTIHLFLRSANGRPYTYLGRLSYVTHDAFRERPVHFQWQLLDWPAPPEVTDRLGLSLAGPGTSPDLSEKPVRSRGLVMVEPPHQRGSRGGVSTDLFRTKKAPDYAARDARNRSLGLKGELLVLEHERNRLILEGRQDLADLVVHTSLVEGDGAGYDIKSFEVDGTVRLIEVKTTMGDAVTGFFISPNELSCSTKNSDHYYLYRLYHYDEVNESALSYVLKGDLSNQLKLLPTAFRAELFGGAPDSRQSM